MKKRKGIILIILFIVIFFIKIYKVTPEEAFLDYANDNYLYHTYRIGKAYADKNKIIIFWHNQYNKLAATVLQEVYPYHWRIIGQVGYTDYTKESGTMWGILNNNTGLYFGYLKKPNKKISSIRLNENETTLLRVDAKTYLWYFFGDYDKFDIEIEYNQ